MKESVVCVLRMQHSQLIITQTTDKKEGPRRGPSFLSVVFRILAS